MSHVLRIQRNLYETMLLHRFYIQISVVIVTLPQL